MGVQGLVVAVAGVHYAIEIIGYEPRMGLLYFVPISLFFVPVMYAALNFGFVGALATGLWALFITLPNGFFWHHGLGRIGEFFPVAIVAGWGVYAGYRIDRERDARHRAEAAGAALKASEIRYRGLFESSSIAVLVLHANGVVIDANPACERSL